VAATIQLVLPILFEAMLVPLQVILPILVEACPKAMLAAPAYFQSLLRVWQTLKQFLQMTIVVVQLLA